MTAVEPCGFMQDPEARPPDPRSQLPITPTAAIVRQAEVDAAYLAVEATRADPIYRAEIQAKAAEARERAHRLRAALGRPMPDNKSGADPGDRLSTDPLDVPVPARWPLDPAAESAIGTGGKA
jgi:hypothetical protein